MGPRPMTVLQVVPSLNSGGAERTTVEIASALVAAGDRALVVSEGGRLTEDLAAAGGEHVTMPVGTKTVLGLRRNAARLADLMERQGVDIIHARSRAPAWSALWAASWTYRPLVTTYHGIYNEDLPFKRRYNAVMARGDVVIANSAFTAGLIRERHREARKRIVTIHRGIDLDAFDRPGIDADAAALRTEWGVDPRDRVILNLARLTPWKGQEVLLAALTEVAANARDFVVVLAGDDQGRTGYLDGLKETVRRNGLQPVVRIVGHVGDVPAALRAATIAVQPSTEPEAFGRAAVEAQAAGVPVVVSDLGAVRETVLAPPEVSAAERSGWRVPPGDADDLAAALIEALSAPESEFAAIGARGRAHAATHFSLSAMQAKTLAVYRSLLNNGGTRLY